MIHIKKELKYLIIEYTEKDIAYIDEIINIIEQVSEEVVNFFDLKDFGDKVKVKLYSSIDDFRTYYENLGKGLSENGKCPSWVNGFFANGVTNVLCLEEMRKANGHENSTIKDLAYLILHEFTHSVHEKYIPNADCYWWIGEGLATTITHQYDDRKDRFDASFESITTDGNVGYINYYSMFKYVLETYGKDYILKLVRDMDFQEQETPRLYDETCEKYKTKNRI